MIILRWVATALFIVAMPLLLVLTSVRIVATEEATYHYSFSQYDAVARTGIERPELDRAAAELITYFRNDAEFLTTRVVIDGREQALFNPRETLHMKDVKALFQWTFRVQELALAYVVAYIAAVFLWSRERSLRVLARQSMLAGAVTVGLLGVAAIGVLVGFDDLFQQFHVLSFSNDFWQLDPDTDRLIQMFPRNFWFDVTLAVGVLAILEGGALVVGGYAYLWWDQRRRSRSRPRLTPLPAEAPMSEQL